MATIQIRIDEKTKKSSKKVLDKLGLDLTSAITLYLRQIAIRKEIPFTLLTENGFTFQQEQEILQRSREARAGKNMSKAMNIDEAIAYLKARSA